MFLLSHFRAFCAELGVPLAEERTLGPSTCLVYLGLEICTLYMLVKIPSAKLEHLKQLSQILHKSKVTLLVLREVTGLLNFCILAIRVDRAFIVRCLNDASCGSFLSNHRHRVKE